MVGATKDYDYGRLVAYTADTGEKRWEARAPTGIIATPVSYRVDGVQYVSVLAGWGGAFGLSGGEAAEAVGARPAGWVLTYRLGGDAEVPEVSAVAARHPPPPPPPPGSESRVKRGSDLYAIRCSVCHGVGGVSGGVLPDLRQHSRKRNDVRLQSHIRAAGSNDRSSIEVLETAIGTGGADTNVSSYGQLVRRARNPDAHIAIAVDHQTVLGTPGLERSL